MTQRFGMMQGRLTPQYKGQYQSHPIGHWQSEFYLAAELGLDCIEFILDTPSLQHNPLMSDEGIREIQRVCDDSGVGVESICADVFMDHWLHSDDSVEAQAILRQLLKAADALNIRDIVIPCVDRSSLHHCENGIERLAYALQEASTWIGDKTQRLSLETDLNPQDFARLLALCPTDTVWVNYDIGNSSSLGFDVTEEFAAYGARISDIHIKDRPLGGASVTLGTGAADFTRAIACIKQSKFAGPLIFQASRKANFCDDLQHLRAQIEWFKARWEAA